MCFIPTQMHSQLTSKATSDSGPRPEEVGTPRAAGVL